MTYFSREVMGPVANKINLHALMRSMAAMMVSSPLEKTGILKYVGYSARGHVCPGFGAEQFQQIIMEW